MPNRAGLNTSWDVHSAVSNEINLNGVVQDMQNAT